MCNRVIDGNINNAVIFKHLYPVDIKTITKKPLPSFLVASTDEFQSAPSQYAF